MSPRVRRWDLTEFFARNERTGERLRLTHQFVSAVSRSLFLGSHRRTRPATEGMFTVDAFRRDCLGRAQRGTIYRIIVFF